MCIYWKTNHKNYSKSSVLKWLSRRGCISTFSHNHLVTAKDFADNRDFPHFLWTIHFVKYSRNLPGKAARGWSSLTQKLTHEHCKKHFTTPREGITLISLFRAIRIHILILSIDTFRSHTHIEHNSLPFSFWVYSPQMHFCRGAALA